MQEAVLRALRYFSSFRGDNARPWLLQIVRHTCFAWLRQNRPADLVALDDEDEHDRSVARRHGRRAGRRPSLRDDERTQVNQALAALPFAYREVLVLREMEDLSYRRSRPSPTCRSAP